MKYLWSLFFLFVFVGQTNANTKHKMRSRYVFPRGGAASSLKSLEIKQKNISHAKAILKKSKENIIKGDLDSAKILLSETTLSQDSSKAIQSRYLALIYFIEGRYSQVLDVLQKPEMLNFSVQAKICFLKVLSLIILDKTEKARISWKFCKEATARHSKTDLTWMQIIVDLKTTQDKDYINKLFQGVKVDTIDNKLLRIYLKLALYLGKQDKIIPRFEYFGTSPLENKIQRELIGLNYYRNANLVKAYQLLEKINTANSEVFKGNIYLTQQKFELAYAQYKLALKRKMNSRNALNRLLPLSWKLKRWDEGLAFLQKIPLTKEDTIATYTLMSVFLTLAKKHKSAKEFISKILRKTNKAQSIEISGLRVLNGINLNDFIDIENSAATSCANKDGLNCWFLIAINSWESLQKNFNSDREIHANLTDLSQKYSKELINDPIIENTLVSQKIIEELDNSLIQLVPIQRP